MEKAVLTTEIKEYPLIARGKVRDIYDLGDSLLFVASDRISAYDYVLPNGIPGKGKILNQMSVFWFEYTREIIPNHILTTDFADFPTELKKYDYLDDRSMIVKKAKRIDIECVARGYLVGSGFKDYKKLIADSPDSTTVNLYGYDLPTNIELASKLDEVIFTPATKEDDGHDMNISYETMAGIVGDDVAVKLREKTIAIYSKAFEYAQPKGIIIADTKFEFGFLGDELTLIDEILSPDSSRFWPVESYKIGANPPSFDKQFIRDYLSSTGWDKNSTPPELPDEIIEKTLEKYKQAYKILVGKDIS